MAMANLAKQTNTLSRRCTCTRGIDPRCLGQNQHGVLPRTEYVHPRIIAGVSVEPISDDDDDDDDDDCSDDDGIDDGLSDHGDGGDDGDD